MKVRFYIEKRKSGEGMLLTEDRPVFMTVAFHGKRAIIATGVKLDLQWWDHNQQRVKLEYSESALLNHRLDSLEEMAGVTWKALASLSGNPGVAEFRELFKKLSSGISHGFFDAFYQFMAIEGKNWEYTTYQKVRTIHNHLREFEKSRNYPLTFKTINFRFLHLFIEFYRERGNSQITAVKAVNIIVWFMNWASDEGYNAYRDYRKFHTVLRIPAVSDKRKIVLTRDELNQIMAYETKEKKLLRVRDIFIFMCHSGLRYREIQNLRKGDIHTERMLVRAGRGRTRFVPINRMSRDILAQYENRYFKNDLAFPYMHLITFNKYLKILCRGAGVNQRISISSEPGKEVFKYQLVTAGVANNTFVANAVGFEIHPNLISKVTGIQKDERIIIFQQEFEEREMIKFEQLIP